MTNSIKHVGDKLVVGQIDTSFLNASSRILPGTAVLNGPVYIGATLQVGVARATCMIGPPLAAAIPASLEVTGISNFIGNINLTGVVNRIALTNASGATIKTGISLKKALAASLGLSTKAGAQITAGSKVCQSVATVPLIKAQSGTFVDLKVASPINGFCTGNKPASAFDLPFVKQKGKRVRHIVTEGPEPGIYIRGTIKDNNTIELPDYWDGLIDPDTITVTLTQIGHSQDLIVKSVEEKLITIESGISSNIHCYYEVWASRWLNPMDHNEKLYVTYDGESPDDYPGNKDNFLVGGWDYDRRDTQWRE